MFAFKPAIFYRFGLMVCISTIAACGSIMDSDKVNYKTQTEAPTAKSLEVPPDLSKITRNKRFDVPGGIISANELGVGNKTDLGPLTSPLALADIQVKRAGNQMWLDIARPPKSYGLQCVIFGKSLALPWCAMNKALV